MYIGLAKLINHKTITFLGIDMSLVPITRISKQRDMLYIYIPTPVREQLEKNGYGYKDIVLWRKVEFQENCARIELVITKERPKIYKLSEA